MAYSDSSLMQCKCTPVFVLNFSFVSDFYWALFKKNEKHKDVFKNDWFCIFLSECKWPYWMDLDIMTVYVYLLFEEIELWWTFLSFFTYVFVFGYFSAFQWRTLTDPCQEPGQSEYLVYMRWWGCLPLVVKMSCCTFYTPPPPHPSCLFFSMSHLLTVSTSLISQYVLAHLPGHMIHIGNSSEVISYWGHCGNPAWTLVSAYVRSCRPPKTCFSTVTAHSFMNTDCRDAAQVMMYVAFVTVVHGLSVLKMEPIYVLASSQVNTHGSTGL